MPMRLCMESGPTLAAAAAPQLHTIARRHAAAHAGNGPGRSRPPAPPRPAPVTHQASAARPGLLRQALRRRSERSRSERAGERLSPAEKQHPPAMAAPRAGASRPSSAPALPRCRRLAALTCLLCAAAVLLAHTVRRLLDSAPLLRELSCSPLVLPTSSCNCCSALPTTGASQASRGMGSSGSKGGEQGGHGSGWQPGVPGQERRYSQSGYDITPLTTEERIAAAKPLTDFQRNVTLQVGAGSCCCAVRAACDLLQMLSGQGPPGRPIRHGRPPTRPHAATDPPAAGGHGASLHRQDCGRQPPRQQAQGHLRQRGGRPAAVQLRWVWIRSAECYAAA